MSEYGILDLFDGQSCTGCTQCKGLDGQECPRRLIRLINPHGAHPVHLASEALPDLAWQVKESGMASGQMVTTPTGGHHWCCSWTLS